MITVRQQSKLIERIKTMSELELASFLEDLTEHLEKNKMIHLLEIDTGDYEYEIRELTNDNERLDRENENLADKLVDIEAICDNALDVEEFEDKGFEAVQSMIQQIKDLC